MNRKKLSLDNLSVESFETTASRADLRGTVRGAQASEETDCASCEGSCGETFCLALTCGHSCNVTCGDSCHGSCMGETCDFGCSADLTC